MIENIYSHIKRKCVNKFNFLTIKIYRYQNYYWWQWRLHSLKKNWETWLDPNLNKILNINELNLKPKNLIINLKLGLTNNENYFWKTKKYPGGNALFQDRTLVIFSHYLKAKYTFGQCLEKIQWLILYGRRYKHIRLC